MTEENRSEYLQVFVRLIVSLPVCKERSPPGCPPGTVFRYYDENGPVCLGSENSFPTNYRGLRQWPRRRRR